MPETEGCDELHPTLAAGVTTAALSAGPHPSGEWRRGSIYGRSGGYGEGYRAGSFQISPE